jgi:hypothetical protein
VTGTRPTRRRRRRLAAAVVATVVLLAAAGCEYGEATGVSDVTDISATLHGTVHSTDLLPEYWFEYDDAPRHVEGQGLVFASRTFGGEWACCGPMLTATDVAGGLRPDTTYHYRFCIRTEDGRGMCGAPKTFRTKPDDRDVVAGSVAVPIAPELGAAHAVSVSVRAEPDGSVPVGRVSRLMGTYYFRYPDAGAATCLRIVGNRAAIGFVAEIVYVEDNGATGDRFTHELTAAAPLDCPDPSTTTLPWMTAVQGDITITDR